MNKTWTTLSMVAWLGACGESDASPNVRPDAGQPRDDAAAQDGSDGSPGADAGDGRTYVTVRFAAKVGSEDFSCARTYPGVGTSAREVAPVDLRLFVQDLALIRAEDGVEVALELDEREGVQRTDVTLLDFETNDGSCTGVGGTSLTNTTVTGWVPAGSYRGIAFTNGVPEAVNHQNPIDLTAPLLAGPLHWNWNGGFLFINAQVREVEDATDGGASPGDAGVEEDAGVAAPGSAVVHIGSGQCSPNQGCTKPNRNRVVLPDFDAGANTIVLDVARIFSALDLNATTTCHAVGVECEAFFPALGIDYPTGAAAATQDIYRVE